MDKPAILSSPEAFVVVPAVPVAWRCSRALSYDGNGNWHYYDGPPNPSHLAKNVQPLYGTPDPTALAEIVAYCAALEAENARLKEAAKTVYEWMNRLPVPTPGCTGKMKTLYDAASAWKENGNG